ncbi:MAG: hypothetical protein AB1758_24495 [Candidatus Eremiobacterota bacterium]
MSQMGIAPGGCMGDWRKRKDPYAGERWTDDSAPPPAGGRELSLKKFLNHKAKELVKEGTFDKATANSVLQDYYRETASEGSGQYDVDEMRATAQLVPLKREDVQWFDSKFRGSDPEFRDIVLGMIVADAMSAIGTDPGLAVALSVSRKG